MERLSDASDVICLFTKRSLNRPWILFEAGVAKGELDTPVHGVALGVPLSQVSTGPFYQFQNCQDDEDGLTGLVIQLLKRIPNAEPDHEAIGLQVRSFKSNVDALLAKIDGEEHEEKTEESDSNETSAAKLFEEIKVMVRDLPSNLEDRFSDGSGVIRSKRFRRFHPMMLEELIHVASPKSPDPFLGVLVLSSLLRDDMPWIYELGMEVYRVSRNNRKSAIREALIRFQYAFRFTMHSPLSEGIMMRSKEGHMIFRELEHTIEMLVDRCISLESESKEDTM